MRMPSGVTDQVIYFVAVDATDNTTRETGLNSFTVYRSRNDGTPVAMTTPTVSEKSAANMPGVYTLLLDEDMTIGAGNDSEEMVFHITHAGMAPVTRTIELYRPKITAGNTLGVASDGDISGNVDGNVVGSVASVTGAVASVTAAITLPSIPSNWITAAGIAPDALDGKGDWNVGKTGYTLSQGFPANFASMDITALGKVTVGTNDDKAGYSISGVLNTLDDLENVSAAEVNTQCAAALTTYDPPTYTEMTTRFDALNDVSAADVNAQCDIALADYDSPTKAEMDAGFTALNDLSPAEVNAEVLDVINVDTYAEPGQGAPGATISLAAKINYLYKFLRNKIEQTSTTLELYNDAGTVVDQKATVSDDGTTATRGEIVSGP